MLTYYILSSQKKANAFAICRKKTAQLLLKIIKLNINNSLCNSNETIRFLIIRLLSIVIISIISYKNLISLINSLQDYNWLMCNKWLSEYIETFLAIRFLLQMWTKQQLSAMLKLPPTITMYRLVNVLFYWSLRGQNK